MNMHSNINEHYVNRTTMTALNLRQCKFIMMTMRALFLMILVPMIVLAGNAANGVSAINVMPMPASTSNSSGSLKLDANFTVSIEGAADPRLQKAVVRFQERLRRRTGVVLPVGVAGSGVTGTLKVTVKAASAAYPQFGDDESYGLSITPTSATLEVNTTIGALRGLETLSQLVSGNSDGYFFPALTIQDKPRFGWRGLMIDVGRHFEPVEVIKRNIDGMAMVKLNVFHWHLSEDQGFRIESKKYPLLHEKGSDGQYYTQDEVREVVAYAADRGVRVVPEFDMPGHTTAWMPGYPELASAPGPYEIERRWGVFDPTMDPTKEETYQFLDTFIGEMVPLFPDEYFHIGGDENNGKQWRANPQIQEFMKQHGYHTTAELQTYFNQRVLKILQKYNKKMVGWDEILTPDLPKESVVQSWRSYKSLDRSAREGYNAIWSTSYYLDHMAPAEYLYLSDPVPEEANSCRRKTSIAESGPAPQPWRSGCGRQAT